MKERRAHRRYPASLPIEGSSGDDGVLARMVARNLSLGGLYCTSSADYPEMTRLAVRLMLPQDGSEARPGPLDLEAVVVRREVLPATAGPQRYRFALFFTRLAAEQRERLQRYLALLPR